MGFWREVKFWIRDTLQSRGNSVKIDSSVSRTIRDATHVRGGGGQSGGFTSSQQSYEQAIKGHENYKKSFKKDD